MSAAVLETSSAEPRIVRRASERDLIDPFRSGDRSAFTKIFEMYQPSVLRFVLTQIRDRNEAEDLVQETFLEAFRSSHKFAGRSSILTWLLGIARFRCLRSFRTARRWMVGAHAVDFEVDPGFDPRTEAHAEAHRILSQCDALLRQHRSREAQRIFRMHYVEGLPIRKIAKQLESNTEAIKSSLRRSRIALRRGLEGATPRNVAPLHDPVSDGPSQARSSGGRSHELGRGAPRLTLVPPAPTPQPA